MSMSLLDNFLNIFKNSKDDDKYLFANETFDECEGLLLNIRDVILIDDITSIEERSKYIESNVEKIQKNIKDIDEEYHCNREVFVPTFGIYNCYRTNHIINEVGIYEDTETNSFTTGPDTNRKYRFIDNFLTKSIHDSRNLKVVDEESLYKKIEIILSALAAVRYEIKITANVLSRIN